MLARDKGNFHAPGENRTRDPALCFANNVKNGNRKWIFSVFQCSDSSNSTVEGKRICCVKQKRSIKSNREFPVAIHEVRDGQRSGYLSSLLCLTRKRNVSQGKDKERLYSLDSHFKSVFLFLFSLAFQ